MARKQTGTYGSAKNYERLVSTYGTSNGVQVDQQGWRQGPDGSWLQFNQRSGTWLSSPGGPIHTRPLVSDTRPFLAGAVFDKVLLLSAVALMSGAGAAMLNLGSGAVLVLVIAALGVAIGARFAPKHAYILAPTFAILEGAALGAISRYFVGQNTDIVPMAVLGTTAIFFGVLALYRTGLVKVGHRFIQITAIATFGLLVMMIGAILGINFGLSSAGATFVIFGVLYLFIGTANLFVDFEYVNQAQMAGVSQDGEWYAALSIMISLVMIYLALLRMLSSGRN